jgi:cardiolipin synthase A/B
MELIIQPKDGLLPLVSAIKKATKQIDITIFRFDLRELQRALESAVTRGVKVHALIASTSGGGQKRLRRLELELLNAGVTVSRTDDDLRRYHYKILLIDRERLYTQGFNYTRLDMEKSRTMAVATKNKAVVAEAIKLFEADVARQPYTANHDNFLVSPENARTGLARFIKSAKKQLLIYDMKVSDRQMLKLLQDRVKAGVDVRIIGKIGKKGEGLICEKMPAMRLHLRAMLRDGKEMFLGSMSLRALELDKRREVGIIVKERAAARQFREVFEEDWLKTESGKKSERDKSKEEKPEAAAVAS